MRTAEETFGISGPDLATEQAADPTLRPSPVTTTRSQAPPPANPLKALLDPTGSAIFWIAIAAVLGLLMVAGQLSIDTKLGLGGRVGRR